MNICDFEIGQQKHNRSLDTIKGGAFLIGLVLFYFGVGQWEVGYTHLV
jgi:hypothetical protein